MLWPALIAAGLLAALIFVELSWRRRFAAQKAEFKRQKERDRTAHEQSLVRLRARQEAVFNSMTEGLLLLNGEGRITLANRAFEKLFGVGVDVRSRTILEAVRLHELVDMANLLKTESPLLDREIRLTFPVERWIQVNGAALTTDADANRGAVFVFHDLTRLKKLESARQDFVANVSHELRTPLSLIKGYVETLLDGAKDNPKVAVKFLQTIQRNSDRLQLLIEDLLTISELESGRMELKLQPLELRPLIDKAIQDLQSQAAARNVKLTNEAADLSIQGDPDRLQQVLCNLLDNAIKYGRQSGHVTVHSKATENGEAEISVVDDGPGIPAEAIERVFERFYRADKARSREQGGTGLGLSIVKHIVQSHGGKVWAASEPGPGATFFFTIPRTES